jgi:hypothetical protein
LRKKKLKSPHHVLACHQNNKVTKKFYFPLWLIGKFGNLLVHCILKMVTKHLPFCFSFKELRSAPQNFKISISGKIIEFANGTIWQAKKCIKSYMSHTLLWPTISINVHKNKRNRSKSKLNHTQINKEQGQKDIYT